MNIGILTVSDRGAQGNYEDRSGPVIAEKIEKTTDWHVSHRLIVPDEMAAIISALREWVADNVQLILTTGGTGFSPRDITPEATRQVIEREAPGIAEGLRAESLKITRHAMLSRGIAGMCGQTLIINLPGSPKAVRENMDVLLPILPHALELLNNDPGSEQSHRTV